MSMPGEEKNPDQAIIDKMIDWRKLNRPHDQSELKTSLSPESLHRALDHPRPRDGKYPESVLYRGYRVLAKVKLKEPA